MMTQEPDESPNRIKQREEIQINKSEHLNSAMPKDNSELLCYISQ